MTQFQNQKKRSSSEFTKYWDADMLSSPNPISITGDPELDAMDDTMGGRLSRARKAMGFSTAQLARRVGVKTTTLAAWETDRAEPRSNRLAMLAGILNVSPTWLLIGQGESPPGDDTRTEELRMLRSELAVLHRDLDDVNQRLLRVLNRIDLLSGHPGEAA